MKLFVNKKIACMVLLSFLFSIVSSAYPGEDSAEKEGIRLLTRAEAYYRNIRYGDALETFLQAEVYLKSGKYLIRLYLGMSKSCYALSDTTNIKTALKKLFEIDPDINIDEGEYPRGYLKIFEETRAEVKAEPAGKKKKKFPWLLVVGGAVLVGGTEGSGDGQFHGPIAIGVDNNNRIYVVDYINSRIQKFDANGKFLRKWGSEGRDNGRFDRPEAIAVDNNSVYVCDLRNERIQIFDYNGNFKKKWEYPQAQQWGPAGIAIDNSNYVYVVDDIDLVIQKFNASGNFIGEWGCYRLICPRGDITVDDHNNLYAVADSVILKIDTSGHFVTAWGRDESDPRIPVYLGVAVDQKGFVYATDGRYDRVQKFKRSDSETNGDGEWDIGTSTGARAGLHRARQYKWGEQRNETLRQ